MLKNTKNPNTIKCLDYVKQHPGCNSKTVSNGLGLTMPEVNSSLDTLHSGRYVRRERGMSTNKNGLRLFDYFFATETPRKKHRKKQSEFLPLPVAPAPTPTPASLVDDIEVLIAVKGSNGATTTLMLSEVLALARKFKGLV